MVDVIGIQVLGEFVAHLPPLSAKTTETIHTMVSPFIRLSFNIN